MHRIWARWRSDDHSQTAATETDHPPSTSGDTSDPLVNSRADAFVSRPIVADIANLLDTLLEDTSSMRGLRPPRRTKPVSKRSTSIDRHGGPHTELKEEQPSNFKAEPTFSAAANNSPGPITRLSEDVSSLQSSGRHILHQSTQVGSVSPWATFGRREEHILSTHRQPVPPSAWHSGSLDTLASRRSSSIELKSSRSKQGSLTSLHRFAGPSRPSSEVLPPRSAVSSGRSSILRIDDEDDVDEFDHGSGSPDQTGSLHNSEASRLHCTRSRSHYSTQSHPVNSSVNPSLIFGSPHTFGNRSPSVRTASLTHHPESASPPPPLPPLEHPELLSALRARSQIQIAQDTQPNAANSVENLTWLSHMNAHAYPFHGRHNTFAGSCNESESVAPLRSALGSTLRRYSSLPVRMAPYLRKGSSADTSAEQLSTSMEQSTSNSRIPDFGFPAKVGHHSPSSGHIGVPGDSLRTRTDDAEPHGPQVALQPEPLCPCYPPRLIPVPSKIPSLQSFTARRAAESNGGRDLPHYMEAVHNFSQDGSNVLNQHDAKDTLRRSASASAWSGRPDKARIKRGFHKSTAVPAASTPKILGAGTPHSHSSILNTPPSSKNRPAHRTPRSASEPGLMSVPETPTNAKGKRKAEEIDATPPDHKDGQHTTFLIPAEGRRSQRTSEVSQAPSSYQNKRVRLSTSSPAASPSHSRPGTAQNPVSSENTTDSWPSRTVGPPHMLLRSGSRATSITSGRRPDATFGRPIDRRRSISEVSIPVSALVAPHAPSLGRSSMSNKYRMRDPRKPPKIRRTDWVPHFRSEDAEGSPIHAWCFFLGFILFPIWYIASLYPVPQTRHVGGTDIEKAVTLDDPQVEHDARTWRNRCRVMSAVSFFTYIPFIILVAIFVPRHT